MTAASGAIPAGMLPVITLWQPWCSLIFVDGYKRHETRSWRYPAKLEGQRIALHAAASLPAERHFSPELIDLCYDAFGCSWNHSLPRGAVTGTARLVGAYPVEKMPPASEEDRIAGDWSAGRFAWALADVQQLRDPVPAKGRQGWWQIDRILLEEAA